MIGRWSPSILATALTAVLASIGTHALPTQDSEMGVGDLFLKLRSQQASNSSSGPGSSNGSYPVSYDQPYRPQIHFSPSEGFMNDPNGLVISGKGNNKTVHMYYQYNPTALVAGNQHWGHATMGKGGFESFEYKNHLPAIAPATPEEGIFSGSAVIDVNNTSGFFDDSVEPEDRIVAIYTLNTPDEESQHVAYSHDGGYTFTKHGAVLRNEGKYQKQFRDPKVFWDAPHSQWVMAVAHAQEFQIGFYVSKDLKSWKEASRFSQGLPGCQYECPGLFQVPHVGGPKSGSMGWVLLISINPGAPLGGSINQYIIGNWDGTTFTASDRAARLADFGKDFYAAQTWDNTDPSEPVILGWASNWQYTNVVPTSPWRSVMTVPRKVKLQFFDENPLSQGYVMTMEPFNTSAITEGKLFESDDGKCVKNGTSVDLKGDGAFEITATVTMTADALKNASTNSTMDLYVHSSNKGENEKLRIGLLAGDPGLAYVDRRFAGQAWADTNPFFTDRFSGQLQALYKDEGSKTTSDRTWHYKMIVDRTITELFVNGGIQSATVLHYWDDESKPSRLELRTGDDHVKVTQLSVKALKSTWA